MAIHKESRKLNYSPQQLFDIVADVQRYPEFLPLWQEVHVSKLPRASSEDYSYSTRQTIQLGPVKKCFCTETRLLPFNRIHIQSSDPLFQTFTMNWLFIPDNNNQCIIEFSLNCVASSLFLRPVFDAVLLQMAHSIVSAFENRARFIYGKPNTLRE
ncbi:MAG: type II toxin-antitoxin system RatA family toxin [gamma proteobacterium symbiont of Lucinoma myriamae]|nr:type II toxin-antitoxin system RatA family toxin [gamma proteobacterium symbiont of Lucinoma myriamae]MCU7819908.1 type II toxin-antitoxin system RatA family toxin [gamma proteobacterium symbiont of Lucinoma myriamae]MCU7831257.1 type II toxin-antitoxin system RatA family toxin [gamma proteobacterium symbiont of Lucinoma myriamae]